MRKHDRDPTSSHLFPVSHEVFHSAVVDFSKFDSRELALLDASNTEILPEGNPTKFVLDLNMRPDLLDDAGQHPDGLLQRAYRIGVILGRRVIKDSIELQDGVADIMLLPEQRTTILSQVEKHGRYIPTIERNLHGYIDRMRSHTTPTHGFYPYLHFEDEVENDFLRRAWSSTGGNLDSFTHDGSVLDEVPRGLKDIFRMYALLEEYPDRQWFVRSALPHITPNLPAGNTAEMDEHRTNGYDIIQKIARLRG